METEKRVMDTSMLMLVVNLAVILFYGIICPVTTFRICRSLQAYEFLSAAGTMPQNPLMLPLGALTQFGLLAAVSLRKQKDENGVPWSAGLVCFAEIILCIGIVWSLNFYYSGIALLVLADLVNYIRDNKVRILLLVILVFIFAFGRYEVISAQTGKVAFSVYLSFYDAKIQGYLSAIESVLVSANILLFVYYMILLFTGEMAEKERIRSLYDQLKKANSELERMTEIRERNRLAREIHDTLGHTLTGIIMASDASLALFDKQPEEARKRLEAVAGAARDGLSDVRQSIRALRPDTLEKHSLQHALEEMIKKFEAATSVKVEFRQEAGDLYFARDEEDALYRIVQECLTNAVRHGQADEISVTIRQQENSLLIDIRDNGKGAADMKEGFGLRHMRERLDLLSGSVAYGNRKEDPEDGHEGFYVIASLPVRKIDKGSTV